MLDKKHSLAGQLTLLIWLSALTLVGCNQSEQSNTANVTAKSTAISGENLSGEGINRVDALSAIPRPSEQRAEIDVDQYLSTLKGMDVAFVGKQIPYTFSDGKIANSEGYEWWVSKHFALKTDLQEDKALLYLELLELSYPHYVALFGMEPPNIQRQRIAVVYGSSREKTRESMLDDGFRRGVHANAGGETMYYNRAGYSFPSHRQQHQRYIVIHETMHAFHMALNGHSTWAPNWITEGLADSVAHHVYDPHKHQLNVMVFDRAPMNYVETGLRQYEEGNQPSIAAINDDPALKRGLNFFIIHFLLNDPERAQYFGLFRDSLMAANPHSEDTLPTANRLLKETFPDWQQLEEDFAAFVKGIKPSFHIVSGPWEQEGNQYFIRSGKQKYVPRLDVALPHDGYDTRYPAMDFPPPSKTPLISLAETDTGFSTGLLVDFVKEHLPRGQVGIALGMKVSEENRSKRLHFFKRSKPDEDSYLELTLEQGRYLVVEGVNLDTYRLGVALSDSIRDAINSNLQAGLAASVEADNLIVTIKAGPESQSVSYSLTSEVKERVISGGISLLADSVGHRLTPHLQYDTQRAQVKQTSWLGAQWRELRGLFKACNAAPQVFSGCKENLAGIFEAVRAGKNLGQDGISKLKTQSLAQLKEGTEVTLLEDLSGVTLGVFYHQREPFLLVNNPSEHALQLQLNENTSRQSSPDTLQGVTVEANTTLHLPLGITDNAKPVSVSGSLEWQEKAFSFKQVAPASPFDGVEMDVKATVSEQQTQVQVLLTGPYSGQSNGVIHAEVFPSDSAVEAVKRVDVAFAPYEKVSRELVFTPSDRVSTGVKIRIRADLVVDGEDVMLYEEITVPQ